MMTISEYCNAYGYKRSTISRCINDGRLEGAVKKDAHWLIPDDARPRYLPHKKAERSFTDNMFDYLRALDRRFFVDEKTLRCGREELNDIEQSLLEAGLIKKSSTLPDGEWHTGYRITEKGVSYLAEGKPGFRRLTKDYAKSGGVAEIAAASAALLSPMSG